MCCESQWERQYTNAAAVVAVIFHLNCCKAGWNIFNTYFKKFQNSTLPYDNFMITNSAMEFIDFFYNHNNTFSGKPTWWCFKLNLTIFNLLMIPLKFPINLGSFLRLIHWKINNILCIIEMFIVNMLVDSLFKYSCVADAMVNRREIHLGAWISERILTKMFSYSLSVEY